MIWTEIIDSAKTGSIANVHFSRFSSITASSCINRNNKHRIHARHYSVVSVQYYHIFICTKLTGKHNIRNLITSILSRERNRNESVVRPCELTSVVFSPNGVIRQWYKSRFKFDNEFHKDPTNVIFRLRLMETDEKLIEISAFPKWSNKIWINRSRSGQHSKRASHKIYWNNILQL